MVEAEQIELFENLLSEYLPGYVSFVGDFMADLIQFLAAGVFLAVMAWIIGYLVYSVFNWLEDMSGR